jgi:hypothetical protein
VFVGLTPKHSLLKLKPPEGARADSLAGLMDTARTLARHGGAPPSLLDLDERALFEILRWLPPRDLGRL